ncbi:MAG: ribonuclease H-like domain-containing protein [Candidatus Omnitrophota bacterium]
MKTVVFDIETVGMEFSQLDQYSREYFLKFSEQEEIENVHDSLSFYPLTAAVVAIGMMDVQTGEGAVYFQDKGRGLGKTQYNSFHLHPCDELMILKNFWKQLRHYDAFVTFNGRMFDCPFIMIRSIVYGLRIERNLLPYRYSNQEHIDLADQLSFYGCLSRKFPLHLWCKTFGIPSPKEDGISGLEVQNLFRQEQYLRIARYCSQDVVATKLLYDRWLESLAQAS